MNKFLINFMEDESGPTAVEYAVMLALIAGVCFASITIVGLSSGGFWSNNADEVSKALSK